MKLLVYVPAIAVTLLTLSSCSSTVDPTPNTTLPAQESVEVQESVTKKVVKKKIVKSKKSKKRVVKKVKVIKESDKPQEVARVCFDKSGKAHNCNYKIKAPYKMQSLNPLYQ